MTMLQSLGKLRDLNGATVVRRLRGMLRAMIGRGDVSTLLITCALMVIPALALNGLLDVPRDASEWPVGLGQLAIVGAASVVFGYLLARSRYSELVALLMSAMYGVATIAILQLLSAPGDPLTRLIAVIARLRDSFAQIQAGAIQDPFLLVLFLSTLFWFLGHNTAWHVFRIDRVWRAVVPPGIVLLINGLYNFNPSNLDLYLIVYVFLSLMLVVRSHIDLREMHWYVNQIGFDRRLRTWFYRTGAVAGIAILMVAWVLPTGSPDQNQQRFQQFMNGDVLTRLTKLWERLLTPLESTGNTSAEYYGRSTLQLSGAIQLGDQEVLRVRVPQSGTDSRYYWQSRVFDTYSGGTWDSRRGLNITAQDGALSLNLESYAFADARRDVTQMFSMTTGPSRLIYAAPEVRVINLPSEAEADYIDPKAKTVNASVVRPQSALQTGDTYSAVSSVSTASANTLRQTAAQYPAWLASDLALDANAAPRARALAVQIVANAKAYTAYDKAKAIENWLRTNIAYDENMPAPPTDQDPVDWALFQVKHAYCTYYASAMVIMLRSQHVAARLAAGFAQGTWDPTDQSYVVRERDAHTWVQVYFPGAGWVEFEPTAAQDALARPDTRAPAPTATATPTFTPSPTPLPTMTPLVKPQNSLQQTVNAPTDTPPPSTTPMVTATPLPLAPPPARPTPFSGLLAFGVLLAGVLTIGSFIGVGALWWIEYRGLDRLSPVGRTYARLTKYGRWLRVPLLPGATPLERGRHVAREVPARANDIVAITDLYIHEQYAPPSPITAGEEERAKTAWQSARWGFIQRKLQKWLRRG